MAFQLYGCCTTFGELNVTVLKPKMEQPTCAVSIPSVGCEYEILVDDGKSKIIRKMKLIAYQILPLEVKLMLDHQIDLHLEIRRNL
jgi:hypothetical protein